MRLLSYIGALLQWHTLWEYASRTGLRASGQLYYHSYSEIIVMESQTGTMNT